jgi:hypothetical protein
MHKNAILLVVILRCHPGRNRGYESLGGRVDLMTVSDLIGLWSFSPVCRFQEGLGSGVPQGIVRCLDRHLGARVRVATMKLGDETIEPPSILLP